MNYDEARDMRRQSEDMALRYNDYGITDTQCLVMSHLSLWRNYDTSTL